MDFQIKVSNEDMIYIYIENDAVSYGEEGYEYVYVTYESASSDNQRFNIPLYVEIVNAISGKKITEESCRDFLTVDESYYFDTDEDYYKYDNLKIHKYHDLTLLGSWEMNYWQYDDDTQYLEFYGYTKNTINLEE